VNETPDDIQLELLTSLGDIEPAIWDSIVPTDYPFIRHHFLLGLETTGCTTAESGWQPCHAVLRERGEIIAIMPMYLKSHSYGEYVFDWSWADAWQRSGLQYYPKLVTAIPFTPCTGPRIAIAAGSDVTRTTRALVTHVEAFATQKGFSSWHCLFPDETLSQALLTLGCHQRLATQFHWFNQGFENFDAFLGTFTSRKRKALRRERRRVQEQGLTLQTLVGTEITEAHWQQFHRFYQFTYAKRSGHGGYLTRDFFLKTAAGMGEQVIMVVASNAEEAVAAALYFRSGDTLYGRYWGCEREYDCLHFETCYYQGIEYCIAEGLQRFDPGAQGEHKIQRGFTPISTYSNHWIAHSGLSEAVAHFTREEAPHSDAYKQSARELLPFRKGADSD